MCLSLLAKLDISIVVELLVVCIYDIIYQVLFVIDLEIDSFAISSEVEYIFVLGLGVLKMAGFHLVNTDVHIILFSF